MEQDEIAFSEKERKGCSGLGSSSAYGVMKENIARPIREAIILINNKINQIEKEAEKICNCEKKKKCINLISHCVQKHNFQEVGKGLIDNSLIVNYWKVRVQAYINQDYAIEVKEKKKQYLSEESIQSYFQNLINIPNFNIAKTSPYNLMKKTELRDLGSSWMNRRMGG
jgi:hypothetical protein